MGPIRCLLPMLSRVWNSESALAGIDITHSDRQWCRIKQNKCWWCVTIMITNDCYLSLPSCQCVNCTGLTEVLQSHLEDGYWYWLCILYWGNIICLIKFQFIFSFLHIRCNLEVGQCFPKELLLVHHHLLRFNLNGQHGLGKKDKQGHLFKWMQQMDMANAMGQCDFVCFILILLPLWRYLSQILYFLCKWQSR